MRPESLDQRRVETGYTLFAAQGDGCEATSYAGLPDPPRFTGSRPFAATAQEDPGHARLREDFPYGLRWVCAEADGVQLDADIEDAHTDYQVRDGDLAVLVPSSDRTNPWPEPPAVGVISIPTPRPLEAARPVLAAPGPPGPASAPRSRGPEPNPASELRELLQDFPVDEVAELCGVSRSTFYGWLDDASLRGKNLERLLLLRTQLRDATCRLPSGTSLAIWLRTPLAADADSPLAYLKAGRFRLFRGCVALANAAPAPRFPGVTSRMPGPELAGRSLEDALERLDPRPRPPEDDQDEGGDGGESGG